mmetsp:Transcript_119844/g.217756  ORF Transcript_119844/g.217756 Transcript_119844/m.217756 type:complete len:263 (+) Transcript_119844:126-914(+)
MAGYYDGEGIKKPEDFHGSQHSREDPHDTWLGMLASAQSMDITNDPRFFQDNVINYRLSAFSGLSVVSGLLVQNAMSQIFDMDKVMNLNFFKNTTEESIDAVCLIVAFVLLVYILFVQMFSIYVSVAQPYHTYRLMTSGPHGFEAAANYYLNKDLVRLRHMAIKLMFGSLPIYLLQMAIRIVVKFDDGTKEGEDITLDDPPLHSQLLGGIFCSLFFIAGFALLFIHRQHTTVFSKTYLELNRPNLQGHMHKILRSMNTDLDV